MTHPLPGPEYVGASDDAGDREVGQKRRMEAEDIGLYVARRIRMFPAPLEQNHEVQKRGGSCDGFGGPEHGGSDDGLRR